jgi:hypothetical protein
MSGWVAAAVVVGGVVGAVGSNMAASKEASATQNAANTAANVQYAALNQQQQNAAPYMAQGTAGIQTYNALTSANPAQVEKTLQATPGYQATYGQGIEAAKRASAAGGLNLSGNQIAGVESFGAQLGDNTYQQAINNALGQEQIGQAAQAGQAANISGAASNLSNIAINQGTNLANISANEIAGITRAGSGAANQLLTYNTLNNLNNPAGGGNPYNLGGSTPVAPAGSNLTYDASGNITGSAPIDAAPPP